MARGIFQSDRTHVPTPVARDIERREHCEQSKKGHVWQFSGEDASPIPTEKGARFRTCKRCHATEVLSLDGEWT